MTRIPRTRRSHLIIVLSLLAVVFSPAVSLGADTDISSWATRIWTAAQRGDAEAMERQFEAIPIDEVPEASVDRFRLSLEQLRANREESLRQRDEGRSEAVRLMAEARADDDLSEALRQAVVAQTLSENFDDAFEHEDIMSLVQWAEQRVPVVERERRWLEAQELLYRLRTFYEGTSRSERYDEFNDHLEQVNRRLGLVAQYAPERLHDMRNGQALRMGEERLGEFNKATAVDWRERLEGVNKRILVGSLHSAARDHIESAGWRPLLVGGLEALKLLATTPLLSDAFPSLADAGKVNQWVVTVDEHLQRIESLSDPELQRSRRVLEATLDDLLSLNRKTLNLPWEVVMREFGDGAMNKLDTYSEIIWPDKLRRFHQATAGNFVGVGILIRHNEKREIMVVNPLEGTPAYFAGVKPNDLIMAVDSDSTVGWSLNDAVDRITGAKGSVVTLDLKREGHDDLITVPIKRDVIKIQSVKGWDKLGLDPRGEPRWNWFIDGDNSIAYVRLTQFTEDTVSDLAHAWKEIVAEADGRLPGGLILDLRHNPGGLLTAAVSISNMFLPKGNIVTGEDKHGNEVWHQPAQPRRALFTDPQTGQVVPTVVLINQGSASASEIVAGCLQAYDLAVVVGERTFGKGSVQTVHHIAEDCRLKLTTQYYRLPSADGGRSPGRLVHKRPGSEDWGVEPDIVVPMSEVKVHEAINLRQEAEIIEVDDEGDPAEDDLDRPDINELLTEGIDPQLETALLLLQAVALSDASEVKHASK